MQDNYLYAVPAIIPNYMLLKKCRAIVLDSDGRT